MGNKRTASAVFAVLAVFAGVLGLPFAPAAVANHPGQPTVGTGFNLEIDPETVTASSGAAFTVVATLSSANLTGSPLPVDFEFTGDGNGDSPATPDATCSIAPNTTQCSITPAGGGGVAVGSSEIVAWVSPGASGGACEADRGNCGSPGTEGQPEASVPGGHGSEPDNTDVSSITVQTASSFVLDCFPDVQNVGLGVSATVTCEQRDQLGNLTATFPVDLERLGGVGDADGGNVNPVDGNNVNGGAATFSTTVSSTVAGTAILCYWLDTDADTDSAGSTVGDGSDCGPESANPGVDDTDSTDVVCIAFGGAQCPGVQPPSPPVTTAPPVVTTAPPVVTTAPPLPPNPAPAFTDAACADGLAVAAFPVFGGPVTVTFTATHPNKPVTITASNVPSYLSFNGGAPGTTSNATLSGPSIGLNNFLEALGDFFTGEQVTLTAATDKANDTCVVSVRPTLLSFGGGVGNPLGDIIAAILGLFLGFPGIGLPGIPGIL